MKISDFNLPAGRQGFKINKRGKYYYRGNWDENAFKKSIAIVGSRRMTRYGREVVDKFVSEIVANSITTISGFMYGVDTEVHQKTVDYGGRTIAVFGCGLDVVYPPENEKLYIQILETNGLVISEYEPSAKPHLWKFPQRNKIVAGLSTLGVLVVEAGENSGSLITAKLARKMRKKVYAVPGSIFSSVSTGCNTLIKLGHAIPVTEPSDIIGDKLITKDEKLRIKFTGTEGEIVRLLENESLNIDEIAMQINKDVVEVGTVLSVMGIKGLVIESGGKFYLQK